MPEAKQTAMPHTHPTHDNAVAPRCHRGPTFARAAHRVHCRPTADDAASAIRWWWPDRFSAQTVFFLARGIAILIAAVAIGFGATGNEMPGPPPTSSYTTTR